MLIRQRPADGHEKRIVRFVAGINDARTDQVGDTLRILADLPGRLARAQHGAHLVRRILSQRGVQIGRLEHRTLRVGQQVQLLQPGDDEVFIEIFPVVDPFRHPILDLQKSFHGGPFLVNVVADVLGQAGVKEGAEDHPDRAAQQHEEKSVTESHPEA